MKFKNVARPAGARGFGTHVHLISIFPEYGQNTVRIEQRSQMIPEILMVKFYKVDIHSLTRGKKCLDVIIKKSVLIRGDVKISGDFGRCLFGAHHPKLPNQYQFIFTSPLTAFIKWIIYVYMSNQYTRSMYYS